MTTATLDLVDQGLESLQDLDVLNQKLALMSAPQMIEWSGHLFERGLILSTSFGIQAAVMLHLVTTVIPGIPVVWVDTGYLPPSTYQFADDLAQRLQLNLKVYQSPISPARMEALYGRLWTMESVDAFNQYDQIRKVEPMQRALAELGVTAWLAGLRKGQTDFRKTLRFVEIQRGIHKIHPILNWSSKDVYEYLQAHDLPYHPLFDQGYVTVGDWHSSRPLMSGDEDERDTRFGGLKQECGLHLPQSQAESASLDSSHL